MHINSDARSRWQHTNKYAHTNQDISRKLVCRVRVLRRAPSHNAQPSSAWFGLKGSGHCEVSDK